jgi:hypothetical protein
MVPEETGKRPAIIFMVVDFPAPLGPKNPWMEPDSTEKLTFETAILPGYSLVTPSTNNILSINDPNQINIK